MAVADSPGRAVEDAFDYVILFHRITNAHAMQSHEMHSFPPNHPPRLQTPSEPQRAAAGGGGGPPIIFAGLNLLMSRIFFPKM